MPNDPNPEIEAKLAALAGPSLQSIWQREHLIGVLRDAYTLGKASVSSERDGERRMGAEVTLRFHRIPENGVAREMHDQCVWSDGCSYWVGWWSGEEDSLFVKNADGTNSRWTREDVFAEKIYWYARLPNLFALGFAQPQEPPPPTTPTAGRDLIAALEGVKVTLRCDRDLWRDMKRPIDAEACERSLAVLAAVEAALIGGADQPRTYCDKYIESAGLRGCMRRYGHSGTCMPDHTRASRADAADALKGGGE